jgi:excisionase family DNA binding protein
MCISLADAQSATHHGCMDTLLTADAAKLLDLTPDAVRRLERRGELHAQRTEGGTRLFDRADVERLARARQHRIDTRKR